MLKKVLIIASAATVVVALCCLGAGLLVWQVDWQFDAPANVSAQAGATPTPIPVIEREPVTTATPLPAAPTRPAPPAATAAPEQKPAAEASPLQQLSTEDALLQASLPQRDQRLLAMRLRNHGEDIPLTASGTDVGFEVGHAKTFWVTDNQATPPRQFQADATLQYVTDHSYWWVENGLSVNEEALARSAERFETQTYPLNREFFGSEWSPGVDGDVRVHIFMGDVPGVAGYYSASNSYSRLAEPYSNEHEMFFINVRAISPGNDNFDGVMAHEFQHMIHWHQDRNEDTWVNEGLSELATFINGYGASTFMSAFTFTPDTQLNTWADSPNASLANYGGSFMFMAYFLQRFGEDMTKAVVAAPENGIEGFNKVLADHNLAEQFDDIFADFLVANILQNPDLNNGHWGYRDVPARPVKITTQHSSYPVNQQATVYQYGADYIELTGSGNLTVEFTGSTRVNVVNNQAHSGRYQWYSHRGDDSNTRLTRTFDLSSVDTATLRYWTWYNIEPDWDYAYVEVSTDGGETWTILQTPHSATTNPSGNAFGPGYTGASGGAEGPTWIEETIDLTPYAGQEIQLRFEYVTDDAVNRPGFTIDDISIPEIGFVDDVESGDNDWLAEGFVRIDNVLPQRFLVQLIELGDDVTVRQLPLDETNYGALTVTGLGDTVEQAILLVSGLTPFTTEPASYQYQITPTE